MQALGCAGIDRITTPAEPGMHKLAKLPRFSGVGRRVAGLTSPRTVDFPARIAGRRTSPGFVRRAGEGYTERGILLHSRQGAPADSTKGPRGIRSRHIAKMVASSRASGFRRRPGLRGPHRSWRSGGGVAGNKPFRLTALWGKAA